MNCQFDIPKLNLAPLHQALATCKTAGGGIPDVVERLTRPPLTIGLSACDDPVKIDCPFDREGAADLLRLNERRPYTPWKMLSRAEQRRARRLWDRFGSNHGLSITPQGAPAKIDISLVLYLMRVLCEATNRTEFPRLPTTGKPGPMWRALFEALPLAQSFLARRYPGYAMPAVGRRIDTAKKPSRSIDARIESAAELIRVFRSKAFKELCRTLQLGASAADVAANPATFRLAVAYARQTPKRRLPTAARARAA